VSLCRSCNRSIVWADSASNGRPMPLDPPDVGISAPAAFVILGGVAYSRDAAVEKVALDRGVSEVRARELLADFTWRTSHFATCPDADKFRRLR
jgi:hypothetical protein